jgi:hypothetical protein
MTDSFYVGEFRWQGEPQNSPVEMWNGKRWILTELQGPTDQEITEWADAASGVPQEALDPEFCGWRRCFDEKEFADTIRAALAHWA